jgi:hypothetical protein
MIGDTWDSKDDAKVILDIEGSQVGKQSPDATVSGGKKGPWTTTSRRELWCFYLYYIVRHARVPALRFLTSRRRSRATMGSPASTLVHPSSKTCFTSRAMTQAIRHSPRRVVAIPHVCCLI